MKARYAIQDIQVSLYRMRVAKGELLKDVPLADLAPEYRALLAEEAIYIHHNTGITIRRVRRGGKKVWRFIDKN
ncbi:hypothetical protein ACGYLM_01470 [Sulfitobacter sp. 1A10445]